eukprot:2950347-Pyramimonas_sp.AAC.1
MDPAALLPRRAKSGPLPHWLQTVGKAERYAIMVGMEANPDRGVFISDLDPAHRPAADILSQDFADIADWFGDNWADFFAKLGAAHHVVSTAMGEA